MVDSVETICSGNRRVEIEEFNGNYDQTDVVRNVSEKSTNHDDPLQKSKSIFFKDSFIHVVLGEDDMNISQDDDNYYTDSRNLLATNERGFGDENPLNIEMVDDVFQENSVYMKILKSPKRLIDALQEALMDLPGL